MVEEEEDRESNFIGRRTGIVTSSFFFGPWELGKFDFAISMLLFFVFLTDLCFKRGKYNTEGAFIST